MSLLPMVPGYKAGLKAEHVRLILQETGKAPQKCLPVSKLSDVAFSAFPFSLSHIVKLCFPPGYHFLPHSKYSLTSIGKNQHKQYSMKIKQTVSEQI